MNKYFTRPKVIFALRELDIGIIGTAKYQNFWPPVSFKKVNDKTTHFNDFFTLLTCTESWWQGGWIMGWFSLSLLFIG